MPRDTSSDAATLAAILEAAQRRDWPRAGALANRALAEGLEHPLALNVAATLREQAGDYAGSLALLERAVAVDPEDVGARNALALCLQRLDRPAESLQELDVLLAAHPELGFAHANRGNALIALGALGRAREAHLRALECEPDSLAALAALASIASHRGAHEEARGWAERVLARVPNFPDAALALAAAELAAGERAAAEARLRRLLEDPRVALAERAAAYGLLGDVLDASGRYAEAFDAYTTCNGLLRQRHARYATGVGVREYAGLLCRQVEQPPPAPWARPGAEPGPAEGHVFLVGFPRSGTTLLEVALDGHPEVVSLEEHELLIDAVRRFLNVAPDLDGLARAGDAELAPLRASYWEQVRAAGVDVRGKVFVDKYPMNTLKLPVIARLFPSAKVLFAVRDPRDVTLGCYRRRFLMNRSMFEFLSLPGTAACYDAVMTFAERVRPALGLAWQDVRYEGLVQDFEGRTRAICDFLGLAWTADLGDFAARSRTREHATPSTAQLGRGLERGGVGHWRHYATQLQPVAGTLARWVSRLGYEPG
jgi:tetratricopeptide (TPR) repeat protein